MADTDASNNQRIRQVVLAILFDVNYLVRSATIMMAG